MGEGGFGSNGSVHWKIVHTGDEAHGGFIRGRDPNIACKDPQSQDPRAHKVPAEYVVRIRFAGGVAAAKKALQTAIDKLQEKNGYGIAEIHVPSVPQPNVPTDDQFEIIVLW